MVAARAEKADLVVRKKQVLDYFKSKQSCLLGVDHKSRLRTRTGPDCALFTVDEGVEDEVLAPGRAGKQARKKKQRPQPPPVTEADIDKLFEQVAFAIQCLTESLMRASFCCALMLVVFLLCLDLAMILAESYVASTGHGWCEDAQFPQGPRVLAQEVRLVRADHPSCSREFSFLRALVGFIVISCHLISLCSFLTLSFAFCSIR